jgi:hypothetical protein
MRFTRSRIVFFTAAIGLSVATAGLLAAVNFHNVTCTEGSNFAVTCTGTISGLGNGNYNIFLTASGPATTSCTNKGGNTAPGQNPANVTSAGVTPITVTSDTNGNYKFTASGNPPTAPSPKVAGCPGNNWTVSILSVDYTSATLTIQPGGVSGTFPVQ